MLQFVEFEGAFQCVRQKKAGQRHPMVLHYVSPATCIQLLQETELGAESFEIYKRLFMWWKMIQT